MPVCVIAVMCLMYFDVLLPISFLSFLFSAILSGDVLQSFLSLAVEVP